MLKQSEIIAVIGILVTIVGAIATVLSLPKGRAKSILFAVIPLLVVVLLLVITSSIKPESPAVPFSDATNGSQPSVKDIPVPSHGQILQPASPPSNAKVNENKRRDIQSHPPQQIPQKQKPFPDKNINSGSAANTIVFKSDKGDELRRFIDDLDKEIAHKKAEIANRNTALANMNKVNEGQFFVNEDLTLEKELEALQKQKTFAIQKLIETIAK